MLLVLAADAVSGAIAGLAASDAGQDATLAATGPDGPSSGAARVRRPGGTLGRLILAGFWVGLAFQAKEIEAWMVLPALGLAYLLSGPGPVLRRAGQLAVAGVVVALVSVSWMTAVSLVPAADRPYADGSHDNSAFEQVFAYNGFGRFGDQTPLQVRAAQLDPAAVFPVPARAADRLLRGSLGLDTGWLVPAVVAVGIAATGLIIWSLAGRRSVPFAAALVASLVAVSLAPAVASVSLAAHGESAFDTPFESARVQEAVARGLGKQAASAVQTAIPEWQGTQNGAPYLMAAQSAELPSLIIYDTGLEALPIGGFDGTAPSPTLAQLQADIRHGLFHLVWIDSGTDPRLGWITTHCTQISKRFFDCVPANAG